MSIRAISYQVSYKTFDRGVSMSIKNKLKMAEAHHLISRNATVREVARIAQVSVRTAYRYWHHIASFKSDYPVMQFLPITYGSTEDA